MKEKQENRKKKIRRRRSSSHRHKESITEKLYIDKKKGFLKFMKLRVVKEIYKFKMNFMCFN